MVLECWVSTTLPQIKPLTYQFNHLQWEVLAFTLLNCVVFTLFTACLFHFKYATRQRFEFQSISFIVIVECVTVAIAIGNDFLMKVKVNLMYSEYACLPIICLTFALFLNILKKNCYGFSELSKTGVLLLALNLAVCVGYVVANSLIFNPWTIGFTIGMGTVIVELTILIILKLPGGVTRDVWFILGACLAVVIATVASVPDYW